MNCEVKELRIGLETLAPDRVYFTDLLCQSSEPRVHDSGMEAGYSENVGFRVTAFPYGDHVDHTSSLLVHDLLVELFVVFVYI